MTRNEAMHIANEIDNRTNGGDYNYCIDLIIAVYNDFEEELIKAYNEGSNDNYKAMKDAGRLK